MKYVITFLLLGYFPCLQAQTQQQKWNRQMQLKNCSIDIKAGQFTATTFIEMEFYNAGDKELEGLHQFDLKPGQVITAFQLDLNGKYRDGTIEEKWKATNAYNSIVGKRIDPALLTLDYQNHYSLRIYPVPARGSRKITFTIQQLLKVENGQLQYLLPLAIPDTVEGFHLSISSSTQNTVPVTRAGIINKKAFAFSNNEYHLRYDIENIMLNKPIAFSIPVSGEPAFCTENLNGRNLFALRFKPTTDSVYAINPKSLTIYWDASASAEDRDLEKEISFLQQYISFHDIRQLTLIPFTHNLADTAVFSTNGTRYNDWKKYLRNLPYQGATQLGCINIYEKKDDLCMIFTDGKNTYGSKKVKTNGSLVFCISSSPKADHKVLNNIVGVNGGRVINLSSTSMSKAIEMCSSAENWILDVSTRKGKIITEQSFPARLSESLFLSGTLQNDSDTLIVRYGNNNFVSSEKQIILPLSKCSEPAVLRIPMLDRFEKINQSYNWETILDFGLEEKVVTPYTAYIVLERIEDYIRYNIEAPKDLQQECERLQYVKSNTRIQRQKIKEQDEFTALNSVVNTYNQRYKILDKHKPQLSITRSDVNDIKYSKVADASGSAGTKPVSMASAEVNNAALAGSTNALQEVVVVGYGAMQKRSVTGSVAYVRASEIRGAQTVEQALQGRVSGLSVTQNTAIPGAAASIIIRGQSSLSGNQQPLFILDGMPVSGNINDLVNVNDIQDITVLKDAQAGAIYGSRAANGAIIINSKKWNNNRYYYDNKSYRLKDMEDVEYMQEILATPVNEKLITFQKLELIYGGTTAFYFDMAQHFFHNGLKKDAFEILMNAAETCGGSAPVQQAVAYVLESWKMFDEASRIYEQLVEDNAGNISYKRDLAWAYYQQGYYQQAVNAFYNAIKMQEANYEYEKLSVKATLLYEMNQVIAAHRSSLDITMIPASMIREFPSELRIVLSCNSGNLSSMKVKEPGAGIVSNDKPSSAGNSIVYGNYEYYYGAGSTTSYQANIAKPGKYRIWVNYYGYYQNGSVPSFVRVTSFKNFGKANQSIEVENVIMDNQYGEIEIAEVKF